MPTFVCFSYSTVPKNGAQAFSASRFYSALSEAGCKVHLVTLDHPQEVSADVAAELLNPAIDVIRIPFSPPRQVRVWRRFRERKTADYDWWNTTPLAATRAVETLLKKLPGSVLVSRAAPLESHLAVYDVRRSARMWIPHFSDPHPIPIREVMDDLNAEGWMSRLRVRLTARTVGRIIREASLVTVTSRNAIRFFTDMCGGRHADKFHVTNHIGIPRLRSSGYRLDRDPGLFDLTHVGLLYRCRWPARLLEELSRAAAEWPQFRLTMFGGVEALKQMSEKPPWLNLVPQPLPCPRQSTDVLAQSQMNLIVDAETVLPYGPFLASKFAYAVGVGRPILGVGAGDCEMAKLRDEFRSTYFADIARPGELASVLLAIRDEQSHLKVPSPALQERFSAPAVADAFLRRVAQAMA